MIRIPAGIFNNRLTDIMTQERNTDIEEVLFEVEQRPIYFDSKEKSQANLFDGNSQLHFTRIPDFTAITNVQNDYVFSVVKPSYKLVTNREAVELGKKYFAKVFGGIGKDDLEVFNVTYPKTKSFCHIDFIHESSDFEPWENDKWTPFLRVTNSYNRTKLLRFDFGFCRWICENGMIFGEKGITLKYAHTRNALPKASVFDTDLKELKEIEKDFVEKLHNLQRYHVPEKFMLPLVCRTFQIKVKKEDLERPKRLLQLSELKTHINELTKQYFNDIGPNGYAALNVLTDFASRPAIYISPESMVDNFQKRTGKWTEEFIKEIKNDEFRFENYLSEYLETAGLISRIN